MRRSVAVRQAVAVPAFFTMLLIAACVTTFLRFG